MGKRHLERVLSKFTNSELITFVLLIVFRTCFFFLFLLLVLVAGTGAVEKLIVVVRLWFFNDSDVKLYGERLLSLISDFSHAVFDLRLYLFLILFSLVTCDYLFYKLDPNPASQTSGSGNLQLD